MTGGAVEQFLDWLAAVRGRSPNTVAAYRRYLATYSEFLTCRGTTVESATGDDVTAFVGHLGAAGRRPSSIARALVAVRALHRYRVEQWGAVADPARAVSAAPVPAADAVVLAVDDVALLLDGIAGEDALTRRDRAILEVLYGAALRPSELVALNRDDIGPEGVVTVDRGGPRQRHVPAGRAAGAAVTAFLGVGGRHRLVPSGWWAVADTGALFLNQRGGRLTRQGVWLILRRWAARAGLDRGLGPQILRHSCVAHLEAAGMPSILVQELLGTRATGHSRSFGPSPELHHAHLVFHPRNQRVAGR